ncbi:BgTH12-02311 [Blumeria graminis f. sp. triticale]|uniref:Bgt-4385 n=3 Tax=Blumeria graminis TaxID=34373 RepID=A0A061HJX1_BLUGR|nr:Protein trafficking PGA2 [Blumeria graminis f. sp. tritici 96224]CAD6502068.1 BgTH12-02311 [Blumeria graminis f. sp. triticale]VDB86034.1 Bgt-4385 [Blumeria graminis f. sp. tritici]
MSAISGLVKQGGDNLVRNVWGMWDGMRLRDYIRIVIIVGGYLLLRPYLLKFAAKIQAKQYAKIPDTDASVNVKISPNQLRGTSTVNSANNDLKDDENDRIASGADWGTKARKRQKKAIEKFTEKEEKKGLEAQGENDDKEIMDLLVDYEEGKDGW